MQITTRETTRDLKDQRDLFNEAQFNQLRGYNWFDEPKEFKLPHQSRFKVLVKFADGRKIPFPIWDLHAHHEHPYQRKEDASYKRCFQFINEKIYDPWTMVQVWMSVKVNPTWKGFPDRISGEISDGKHYDVLVYWENQYSYSHCALLDWTNKGIHTMVNFKNVKQIPKEDRVKNSKAFLR